MTRLTCEQKEAANLLLSEIMTRYDRVVTQAAIHAIRVCGDRSYSVDDIKQDIYCYIMRFSLHKFMTTDNWLPNVKMMSRNACHNFLQKVKSKKRQSNQYTLQEEICDLMPDSYETPQSILEILETIEYLPALRRRLLDYLISQEDKYERFSVANVAKYLGISPSTARKEYLALQEQLGY